MERCGDSPAAETMLPERASGPNGAAEAAPARGGADIPAGGEGGATAESHPPKQAPTSDPAAEVPTDGARPRALATTAERVAPTRTPFAGTRRGPGGGQPSGQERPEESATPDEGPSAAAAGDERGGDEPAAAGASPIAVAEAFGPSPREGCRGRTGDPHECRFLDVMAEIVSEAAAPAPSPGSKLGATLGGGQGDVLARLIILSRKLSAAENAPGLYHQAFLAASLFRANRGNPAPVAAVLDDIDFSTSRNTPIYTVLRGLVWSVWCLSAAAFLVFGVSSFIYARSADMTWHDALAGPYLRILTSPLLIAVAFGMLGSVVSILLRLSEFEGATRRSRQFLMMTGVMLPLVGAIFASVTCALFASGIVNFNFAAEPGGPARAVSNPYFYIVVGFLSGFSERFTKGLLGTAEKALSSTTRVEAENITTKEGSATTVTEVKRTVRGQGGNGVG